MLHRMCPVEEVCAYESMRAAKARMEFGREKEAILRIRKLAGTSQTQMQNAFQVGLHSLPGVRWFTWKLAFLLQNNVVKSGIQPYFQAVLRGATPAQRKGLMELELMLALQPWAQTTEFLAAVGGRAVLHLDASRKMRERTGKYYHFVRRSAPKDPDMPQQPKIKPGTVTGTDADLRKLTMPQSERILKGFGVAESVIKVGRCTSKLNALDPKLESACFQPS